MQSLFRSILPAALLLMIVPTAYAELVFNGFGSTAGLTLNGTASTAATADGTVLRLTTANEWASGSSFSTARVSTSQFTSIFSFRITGNGGSIFSPNTSNGADGLVFTVQNVANNVGGVGGGLGFENVAPSVGVEFDTFHNLEHVDQSQSHVAIDLNGSVNHNAKNGPTSNVFSPQLDEGNRWWSWVQYNDGRMQVFLLPSESATEPLRPAAPILDYELDLAATLGQQTAFAGFTSGTGSDYANHDILYWRYTNAVVPEPSSLLLAGLGASGVILAAVTRSRRCGR
jgi:hypothetical protein